MLRNGMQVDVTGGDWKALHLATMHNRTGVVKLLLQKGADVNRQTRYDKDTPLHLAAINNHTEVAQLLMWHGADINIKNNNNKTPLDEARKGSEIQRLLLQLQQNTP